ncbi:FMN-binding protein [Colwelliaceae bacterium 6471]
MRILLTVLLFMISVSAAAKGTYLTSEQFVSNTIGTDALKPKMLWLDKTDKDVISDILSHSYNRMRVRYWQKDNQTVWILEEIGKEKPITVGVHINNRMIADLKVLAFRESRGDEVRHEFFTTQFQQATLNEENMLNQHIDGITGATMSVRALTKVARLALWLNKKVQP